MLWTPNSEYVGITNNYVDFWPGEDKVDMVGLSIFANKIDPTTQPSDLAAIIIGVKGNNFHDQFAVRFKKDMIIAETAAGTYIGCPEVDEVKWKQAWWKQLYSTDWTALFPQLKGAVWFESTKQGMNFGIFDRSPKVYNTFVADVGMNLKLDAVPAAPSLAGVATAKSMTNTHSIQTLGGATNMSAKSQSTAGSNISENAPATNGAVTPVNPVDAPVTPINPGNAPVTPVNPGNGPDTPVNSGNAPVTPINPDTPPSSTISRVHRCAAQQKSY